MKLVSCGGFDTTILPIFKQVHFPAISVFLCLSLFETRVIVSQRKVTEHAPEYVSA